MTRGKKGSNKSIVSRDRILRSHTAHKDTTSSQANRTRKRRSRADPWAPIRRPNPNRKPPPTHFACRICIEEQPRDQFIKWIQPYRGREHKSVEVPYGCVTHLSCNPHKRNADPVCKTCIRRSIVSKMEQQGVRHINQGCLEIGCKVRWEEEHLMRYMDSEALEKYNFAAFEVWKSDVRPRLFTCPSPTCNARGLPDIQANGFPQVSCSECATRACVQCKVPWHKRLSCTEFRARAINKKLTEEDRMILKFMDGKDGRRCPNCQLVIEKDGGCHIMECSNCNTVFKWESAASAIMGARMAEPYLPILANYWNHTNIGKLVCEQDAIDEAGSGSSTSSSDEAY